MQDHPGAPGTARQGSTRTIVSTNRGGKATQPRAPGHERPLTAQRAARHGRLSAATRAPGADVPLATTARAPGQHCLSAAPRAPGHERPLAAQRAAGHDRLSAALRAPGADVPLATTARAPGQHRLSAAPIATAPVPAGLRRLRQVILPRTPATPNTLTYPHSHRLNRHSRLPLVIPAKAGIHVPPLLRGDHRGTTHRQPALRTPPLPPTHNAALPPIKCILPSKYRPARGLAPPRVRASSASTPPAPPLTSTRRQPIPSPGACSGGGLGRGLPTTDHRPLVREAAGG